MKNGSFHATRSFALMALLAAGLATPAAQAEPTRDPALLAAMAGRWTATLGGNTGCGDTSLYVTFRLNADGKGNGTATIQSHSTGCGDSTTTGQNFNIISLNAFGRGKAGLTCGTGCGWTFDIQVAEGAKLIGLADVFPNNPNNTPGGVAIKWIE